MYMCKNKYEYDICIYMYITLIYVYIYMQNIFYLLQDGYIYHLRNPNGVFPTNDNDLQENHWIKISRSKNT